VNPSEAPPTLALIPEYQARALLAGRALSLRVLLPPYPALGLGTLRVLRIAERGERTEIVAGYEAYERLDASGRRGASA